MRGLLPYDLHPPSKAAPCFEEHKAAVPDIKLPRDLRVSDDCHLVCVIWLGSNLQLFREYLAKLSLEVEVCAKRHLNRPLSLA